MLAGCGARVQRSYQKASDSSTPSIRTPFSLLRVNESSWVLHVHWRLLWGPGHSKSGLWGTQVKWYTRVSFQCFLQVLLFSFYSPLHSAQILERQPIGNQGEHAPCSLSSSCASFQAHSWTVGPHCENGQVASGQVSPACASGCIMSKLCPRSPGSENWLHTPRLSGTPGCQPGRSLCAGPRSEKPLET